MASMAPEALAHDSCGAVLEWPNKFKPKFLRLKKHAFCYFGGYSAYVWCRYTIFVEGNGDLKNTSTWRATNNGQGVEQHSTV